MTEGKSYTHEFRNKDTVKQALITKFSETSIIILAQTYNWNTLSQHQDEKGVRVHLTTTFSNRTNPCFTFPRTSNEITFQRIQTRHASVQS